MYFHADTSIFKLLEDDLIIMLYCVYLSVSFTNFLISEIKNTDLLLLFNVHLQANALSPPLVRNALLDDEAMSMSRLIDMVRCKFQPLKECRGRTVSDQVLKALSSSSSSLP